MVSPIRLTIQGSHDMFLTAKLYPSCLNQAFKCLFPHPNSRGQAKFGAANSHMRIGPSVLCHQSNNSFGENPVVSWIGVHDARDLSIKIDASSLRFPQMMHDSFNAVIGHKIGSAAMRRDHVEILHITD